MTLYLIVFLIVIVGPIGTIIHELGHGIMALLMKADSVILHIGIGKHVKTFVFRRFTIRLNIMFFIGGLTESEHTRSYNTLEKMCIALGGPACNAILAVLCIILFYPTHNPYIQLFILFQAWLMFINIIPFKWRGKKSDGYTMVQAMAERMTKYK